MAVQGAARGLVTRPAGVYAFRVDASLQIGTGHVMRCLALASVLQQRGARCHFIGRELDGHLLERIASSGHAVHRLAPAPAAAADPAARADTDALAHAHWLQADWRVDARQTAQVLQTLGPDWLVVDHYALDERWEAGQGAVRRLVIDDLADRRHACELLLDANLGRVPADYATRVPAGCGLLLGPRHALLRPEFAQLRASSLARRRTAPLGHILVTMGGVDAPDATGEVLRALKAAPQQLPAQCRLTVVMGTAAPRLAAVRALAATLPWPVEVMVDSPQLAQRMADSDVCIGAAGTTAWERCCLGVPTVLLALADNQRPGARALQAAGAATLLGSVQAIRDELPGALQALRDDGARRAMSERAAALTEGTGCEQLARQLARAALDSSTRGQA
jgi:UDP-2,4-diacetamido-2,4,6-trideoxy-beta-L-altropyranose hydrolase